MTWSLAAQPVNGNIEVHAQVHSNVVGQNWQYRIVKMTPAVHSGPIANSNGAHQVVAKGTISTHNPNGAFQVRVLTEDRSGPEKITFRAVNAATNTVCSGSLVV